MGMYTGSLPEITNRETWDASLYLYDDTLGPDEFIDLSDVSITMTLRDQRNDCQILTGSSDGGEIIITDAPGVIQLNFSPDRLARLCGTYNISIRLQANDITREIFRGTISILEGFDRQ